VLFRVFCKRESGGGKDLNLLALHFEFYLCKQRRLSALGFMRGGKEETGARGI